MLNTQCFLAERLADNGTVVSLSANLSRELFVNEIPLNSVNRKCESVTMHRMIRYFLASHHRFSFAGVKFCLAASEKL